MRVHIFMPLTHENVISDILVKHAKYLVKQLSTYNILTTLSLPGTPIQIAVENCIRDHEDMFIELHVPMYLNKGRQAGFAIGALSEEATIIGSYISREFERAYFRVPFHYSRMTNEFYRLSRANVRPLRLTLGVFKNSGDLRRMLSCAATTSRLIARGIKTYFLRLEMTNSDGSIKSIERQLDLFG